MDDPLVATVADDGRTEVEGVPVMTNREWLERLWADGQMPIRRAPLFGRKPHGVVADWERVEGMLLGLAIGDALGNTSEGLSPRQRTEFVGEVRDYRPNRYLDHRAVGLPSDDTQMAFWTVEHLLEHGHLDPGDWRSSSRGSRSSASGRPCAASSTNWPRARRGPLRRRCRPATAP